MNRPQLAPPLSDAPAPLPAFSAIRVEHIESAVRRQLEANRADIQALLDRLDGGRPDWENCIKPLELLSDRLHRVWAPINQLQAVKDSAPMREAYNRCLPLVTDYHAELGQDRRLFRVYQALASRTDSLDRAQRKLLTDALRDFRLAGIDLGSPQRERFRELQRTLSALSARYEQNLLDASEAWVLHIEDERQLSGLPSAVCDRARHMASRKGRTGWCFGLDFASRLAIMEYADTAELRRQMYTAYCTRASDQGPHAGRWDNGPLLSEILRCRTEQAELLGFPSYAHYSLATRMASEPAEVLEFLGDLIQQSLPVAQAELAELQDFAAQQYGARGLQVWDVSWYSERLRQHRYALSREELHPYFALPAVLDGLFQIVRRLYGLDIRPHEGVDVWHPDVRFFDIRDADGALRGSFYLDLYERAGKRDGAWMEECTMRRVTDAGVQHPVAWLNCNFSAPVDGEPSLLDHDEVLTLFHEFGHGLHHILSRVDHAAISGINGVPWDAVEMPSQFMENWCWERPALALFARHHATGEPLADSLYQRMHAARNFQSGMRMMRQLEYALFDFRLHCEYAEHPGLDIRALLHQVRQQTAVLMPPDWDRMPHGFAHIFSGGYAAGYYSYKWAEALAADAFARFEEEGIFNRGLGREFMRHILEPGGSEDFMVLFQRFRGRPPDPRALLRRSGILG